MKYIAVLIFALSAMLACPAVFAETYDGDLSLHTQAEVDAFGYSEVTGSLTISGDDIVDLSPLAPLTRVGEYLSISDNTALVVVDGFPNLTDVGWGIYVWENTDLVSFSGFGALLQTGDNIDFWFNDSLVSISGFGSLNTVGWSLEIGGNAALTSIPAFDSLQTINSSLFILGNSGLNRISGFKALQHIDWSLDIEDNASLATVCGFYPYFAANGSFTGDGSFIISENHPDLPSPTTVQDIMDAGPCAILFLDNLVLEIGEMGLSMGTTNFLVKSLANAKKLLESGRDGDAVTKLEALVEDIDNLERRGRIDGATADYLMAAVLEIIGAI